MKIVCRLWIPIHEMKEKPLYPLKFKPILKDVIWGGTRLRDVLGKPATTDRCGESWEISAVQGNISVVDSGFLAGNNLQDLIEIYMGKLVGEHIYEKFGLEFPLLIKFIDANDLLSIQVHPDDEMARERHNAYGKTEMWYILTAERGARLISGFKELVSREVYLEHFNAKTLPDILNFEEVETGDVYFTPAGRVHSIGAGILLAEIQQTSDITYRIYDWDRVDANGKSREMHTELALDAIDFKDNRSCLRRFDPLINSRTNAADCPYFTTDIIYIDRSVEKDFHYIDSFVIYICVEGSCIIRHPGGEDISIHRGETMLIPSSLKSLVMVPETETKILEIYIK